MCIYIHSIFGFFFGMVIQFYLILVTYLSLVRLKASRTTSIVPYFLIFIFFYNIIIVFVILGDCYCVLQTIASRMVRLVVPQNQKQHGTLRVPLHVYSL